MKTKIFIIIFSILLFNYSFLFAQENENDDPNSSIFLILNQDPVFGFFPSAYGNIPINKDLSFVFYGIYWTMATKSEPTDGLSLLGEFGVGFNYQLIEGMLYINPVIGIGNGIFQSGAKRTTVMDNYVLNLNLNFVNNKFNANAGFVFWLAGRKEGAEQINQYDYFFNTGYGISKNFEAGLYYEQLLTNSKILDNDKIIKSTETTYFWVGPYIKFIVSNGSFLMTSFGFDFADYINGIPKDSRKIKEYYKMSLGFSI